jgi:aminoglycoside 3-N-acetyltransferase
MSKKELIQDLSDLGLSDGDTLLIHNSLIHFDYNRFGGIEQMAEDLFDAVTEIIGDEGTLIVPTFTLEWVENHPNGYFDLGQTESEMGVFTELVRNKQESIRTLHPHSSFAIYGERAEELGKLQDVDTYGRNYMFGKLHDINAQIMSFGLPYNDSFTYFHYIEQQKGVEYRYKKWFSGEVAVGDKTFRGRYSIYVRDLAMGVETNIDPMGAKLEQRGVINTQDLVGGEVKMGRAKPIFTEVFDLMEQQQDLMYEIED